MRSKGGRVGKRELDCVQLHMEADAGSLNANDLIFPIGVLGQLPSCVIAKTRIKA